MTGAEHKGIGRLQKRPWMGQMSRNRVYAAGRGRRGPVAAAPTMVAMTLIPAIWPLTALLHAGPAP